MQDKISFSSLLLISQPFLYKSIHKQMYQGLNSLGQCFSRSAVADGQAHWALCKHPGNVCPANYYPHQTSTPLAKLPCPVTLTLDSCVSIYKSRLCPTQADKGTKTKGNIAQRFAQDWFSPVWFNDQSDNNLINAFSHTKSMCTSFALLNI